MTLLAFHAGLTRVHACDPQSPALDICNNVDMLLYDQRDVGYTCVSGASADIGAYERQDDNVEIFYSGIE